MPCGPQRTVMLNQSRMSGLLETMEEKNRVQRGYSNLGAFHRHAEDAAVPNILQRLAEIAVLHQVRQAIPDNSRQSLLTAQISLEAMPMPQALTTAHSKHGHSSRLKSNISGLNNLSCCSTHILFLANSVLFIAKQQLISCRSRQQLTGHGLQQSY
jgi:hypothetical protein